MRERRDTENCTSNPDTAPATPIVTIICHWYITNEEMAIDISLSWQAYSAALSLSIQRKLLPELRIPMAVVPATISNNVPGEGRE